MTQTILCVQVRRMLSLLHEDNDVPSTCRARAGQTLKEPGVHEMLPRLSTAHLVRCFVLSDRWVIVAQGRVRPHGKRMSCNCTSCADTTARKASMVDEMEGIRRAVPTPLAAAYDGPNIHGS